METNTTTAHPFIMADDIFREGDVAVTNSLSNTLDKYKAIEVWVVAHRHPQWQPEWRASGGIYFTSKDAALRNTSRMLRNNPSIWQGEEFLPILVNYYPQ